MRGSKGERMKHTKTDPACREYRYREPRNPITRYLDRRARGKSCPACAPTPAHWLVNRDAGWGCQGCEWTGANLGDFWKTHERRDHDIPF